MCNQVAEPFELSTYQCTGSAQKVIQVMLTHSEHSEASSSMAMLLTRYVLPLLSQPQPATVAGFYTTTFDICFL